MSSSAGQVQVPSLLRESLGNWRIGLSSGHQHVAVLFVTLVLCLTGADLLGWLLHVRLLTSFLPHYSTMKPNTAVSLALLGLALLLRLAPPPGRRTFSWTQAAADLLQSVVLLIAGLTLAEYAAHISLGLDQLLLPVQAEPGGPAGRMAIGSAVGLTLTASAQLFMDRSRRLGIGLFLTGMVLSIACLVGFLFSAGPLAGVFWLKSIAVHTALCLLLLQWAGLAARPEREPFRSLTRCGLPGAGRNRLLLSITVLPVLLAVILGIGLRAGLYDQPFALSLLLVLLLSSQTLLLWSDNRILQSAHARVRESEARSSRILESIGDAVIVTDALSRVTRMNRIAEQLSGWSKEQATGRPLAEVLRLEDEVTREAVENPADKVRRLGTVVGLGSRVLLIARDGTEIPIDDSGAPVLQDDGELSDIVVIFRSASERRQAEKALLQSEKLAAVGRLASSISHEINNPLESVTNLLYLAQITGDQTLIRQYLDTAERELRRVAVITSQTLRFHKQSTKPVPVNGEDLIDDVLSMYMGRTSNAAIEVEKRLRAGRQVVCFDGEIRQVLGNLVGNAIDALPPTGGRLLVRTRDATQWATGRQGLVLTIADTGAGMSEATRKRIFEPFFTTKGEVGNGLGLWVSHEIVKRHDGLVRVRSRQDHGGSVFTLFLPGGAGQPLQ